MTPKYNPDDYDSFYLELPQLDFLSDIEIQDEYEDLSCDKKLGLSEAQVSEIARDSLNAAKEQLQVLKASMNKAPDNPRILNSNDNS